MISMLAHHWCIEAMALKEHNVGARRIPLKTFQNLKECSKGVHFRQSLTKKLRIFAQYQFLKDFRILDRRRRQK